MATKVTAMCSVGVMCGTYRFPFTSLPISAPATSIPRLWERVTLLYCPQFDHVQTRVSSFQAGRHNRHSIQSRTGQDSHRFHHVRILLTMLADFRLMPLCRRPWYGVVQHCSVFFPFLESSCTFFYRVSWLLFK